jgi:acetyl-CoA acetyltransferase
LGMTGLPAPPNKNDFELGVSHFLDAGLRSRSDRWQIATDIFLETDIFLHMQHLWEIRREADLTGGKSLAGVPVINVNNNCATGGTALYLAKMLVQVQTTSHQK